VSEYNEKGGGAGEAAGLAAHSSTARLFRRFYDELRALAGYHLSSERRDHTLQPTALVHEAYFRLVGQTSPESQNRTRFLSVASGMMRRILVDHARQRNANKRGGKRHRASFDEIGVEDFGEETVDVLDLDLALGELAELNPRQARLVELRFFGGFSLEETAEALGVSVGTVKGEWRFARAWLRVRLAR
jgi:RNA polymerase sigma factor (TIGR02999 family)